MEAALRIEALVVDACALLERGDERSLAELAQLAPLLRCLADDTRDAEAADTARALCAEIAHVCADVHVTAARLPS